MKMNYFSRELAISLQLSFLSLHIKQIKISGTVVQCKLNSTFDLCKKISLVMKKTAYMRDILVGFSKLSGSHQNPFI